jgi:hypothetical protein
MSRIVTSFIFLFLDVKDDPLLILRDDCRFTGAGFLRMSLCGYPKKIPVGDMRMGRTADLSGDDQGLKTQGSGPPR